MVISVTYGAGEENRTLVPSLENSYSTIELHPQFSNFIKILSETGELSCEAGSRSAGNPKSRSGWPVLPRLPRGPKPRALLIELHPDLVGPAGFEPTTNSLRGSCSTIELWTRKLVPRAGLEPTQPCGQQILSLSRLPISPPRRIILLFYLKFPSESEDDEVFGIFQSHMGSI